MMDLYNTVCEDCSKLVTKKYSTSFSMGIRLFDKSIRTPIYSIYGFVRFADEIVDTFHNKDKGRLLKQLRLDTYQAIEDKISLNPILHAFQKVVHTYHIPVAYIDAFLDSMAMDLDKFTYNQAEYEKYIYGSAEVIGLMCLKVFVPDPKEFDPLVASARSLGSAFQKINFLRDVKSDYHERGRVYFPDLDIARFTEKDKKEIEADIEKDFDDAEEGIRNLPKSARRGVKIAYSFYRKLLADIKTCRSSDLMSSRIRVPNRVKLQILLKELFAG